MSDEPNAKYLVTFFDGGAKTIEFDEPNQWYIEDGYLIFENLDERMLVMLSGVQSIIGYEVAGI